MRIRYIGWLATDNLGDIAVYRALQQLFRPGVLDPAAPDPDAFMIGGGTLLFRQGAAEAARSAADSSGSVFVFGSGAADPEFGEVLNAELWNAVLERCFFVGVRGFRTREVLQELGCRRPIEVTGDPALLLEARPAAGEREPRRIVVNICNTRHSRLWGGDNRGVRARVVEAANGLVRRGFRITFVSFESRNDSYVEAAAGQVEGADFIAGHRSLEGTMDLLGRCRLVIGEKLHAVVLAAAAGTPFIALEYRPKCRDFAESVGCGHRVLRTDTLSSEGIIAQVEEIEASYAGVRRELHARVTQWRERLRRAAADVQRHLASGEPVPVPSNGSEAQLRTGMGLP
jgi:polysaccharide pyruvyl transferase WcaK-like protein